MKRTIALLLACIGLAFPLVVGYHVEPVKAQWSGWTSRPPPNNAVSEVITCNFDELDTAAGGYAELFVGDFHDTTSFNLNIYEYPDGVQPIASALGQHPTRGHTWLRFPVVTASGQSFTKGKKYEFRFTRSGSDSIQYYYDSACGYDYGQMIAPYPPVITPSYGLAMRCYGRMRAVDSLNFGADEFSWWTGGSIPQFDPWELARWTESAHVNTVRLDVDWHEIQFRDSGYWDFTLLDSSLESLHDSAGCRIVGLLTQVPKWASTRIVQNDSGADTCFRCPPQRLECRVGSDSNYLARFLRALIAHCDNRGFAINDWEVGNEVNSQDSLNSLMSWWVHPNFYYTDTPYCVGPGFRDMCSLYVRYAVVVDSAIRYTTSGHLHDKIAVNSVNWVNTTNTEGDTNNTLAGKEWLRGFYDIVGNGPYFWDAISAHPYQETIPDPPTVWPFKPWEMESHAETLRSIMREHGDYGELWNTEFSMPGVCWWNLDYFRDTVSTPEQEANYCCQVFTAAEGMKALPGGCFDRTYWWHLRAYSTDTLHLEFEALWGLHGDDPNVPLYAYKQTAEQLIGKRLNGRVMTGDTAIDNHTRVYEFEDTTAEKKRTWVCWQDEAVAAYSPLSVRSDTVDTVALAYNGSPPFGRKDAENSGWLHPALQPRPTFVAEKSAASRPDLVVDSVRYVLPPSDTAVLAWVTNRGNRATPLQSPGSVPYPTWAVLYANGDSLAEAVYTDSVPADSSVVFEFARGAMQTPPAALLEVRVNPGQSYIELGMDDNTGYTLAVQP
ncbi:hypothetical protein JXD38_03310 [candidate division WOR-3 bacterium]|nr:hypothetical protein [candidate division WOR-3 bacterium]